MRCLPVDSAAPLRGLLRPLLPWLIGSLGLHALLLAEWPQTAPNRNAPEGLRVLLRPKPPAAPEVPVAKSQLKPVGPPTPSAPRAPAPVAAEKAEVKKPAPARPLDEVVEETAASESVLARPFDAPAPPQSLHWRYRLQNADGEGVADLRWEQDGEHYRANLTRRVGDRELPQWQSSGRLAGWGLQPLRFETLRNGRVREALSFEPETARLWHSAQTEARHLPEATQDRLSWILQLAAWLNGRAWRPEELEVDLLIVGWRGEPQHWRFVLPRGGYQGGLLHLRGQRRFGAHEIEVWLDPGREYLPVRLLHALDGEPRSEWQFDSDLAPEPSPPSASAPP
jgi:hypothetical protein